jgi:Ni,Fe-hydrogenase III large subunit
MAFARWWEQAEAAAGAPGIRALVADSSAWRALAQDVAASGGRLLAHWADTSLAGRATVHALYLTQRGGLTVELQVAGSVERYPGIDDVFPSADRMQRAVFDLHGLRSMGADQRPWLRHAPWPSQFHPLAAGASWPGPHSSLPLDDYAFVRVEGDGVHEVPVGPVHAGIIEPGHFRFSIVGEKVLRLEERLGYVHKGVERRFQSLTLRDGHRLAARVSGDSAVAFSWAYCQALEGAAAASIPTRSAWLRALALELERVANHLGDLGALGNDAGFAFGLAQFSLLKERLLQATEQALGQRYLLDFVVPGGTSRDLTARQASGIAAHVTALAGLVGALRLIYDEHAGLRDRFAGAGIVPCEPYAELEPFKCVGSDGDVLTRVALRFDEVRESCALIARIAEALPAGPHLVGFADPPAGSRSIGLIEGWRGPVAVSLVAGADGSIRRCHPQDPSWHNWPVLEHAVIGNIVPDFPLINKSFNLSYSGHDL